MSGALRSKAPLLFCRGGLTALARDGVAATPLGSGGLPAAAATGWRQGAHQASTASWASCLHTSAPRRNQEEAAGGAAAEVASSGLYFTPDASAAGGALIGLAGALGAAAAAIDKTIARRLCKASCTPVTEVQQSCHLWPPIPREIAAGLRSRGARQNVQRPPPPAAAAPTSRSVTPAHRPPCSRLQAGPDGAHPGSERHCRRAGSRGMGRGLALCLPGRPGGWSRSLCGSLP